MKLDNYESGAIAGVPAALGAPSIGNPTNGDAPTAVPATQPGEYWYYQIQEEIRNLIEDEAGLVPDDATLTQLADAIKAIIAVNSPPEGYINGLTFTKAADADHDMTLSIGQCMNAAKTAGLTNLAAITKQIDVAWVEGDDAGGFFPGGGVQADTEYHLCLISKDADGTLDWGYDTSPSGANTPANWTFERRLGSRYTDSSSNILQMVQQGDLCLFETPILDINTTQGTVAILHTLTVPTTIKVMSLFNYRLNHPGSGDQDIYFSSPDVNDQATSRTASPLATLGLSTNNHFGIAVSILTNTSGQIRARAKNTNRTLRVATLGWVDSRGKD